MHSFFFPAQNPDEMLYEQAAALSQLEHQELAKKESELASLENELATLLTSKNDLQKRLEKNEKQFRPLQRMQESIVINRQLKLTVIPLTAEEYRQWATLRREKNEIEIQLRKLRSLPGKIDLLREEIREKTAKINQAQRVCDEAIARREQAKELRRS